MATETRTERPLRRDAERNRQRIVDAARVVFAERGLGVSMDEIARQAGVGVGTVYRRFPDKEELIDALFFDGLAEIVAIAEAALALDDAWDGLVSFLEGAIEHQCADRGLKEVLLSSGHGRARIAGGREQIAPLVEEIVDRAKRAGTLRDDVAATDFALLQMSMGAIVDYTRDADPQIWRRLLALTLDGLRPSRDGHCTLPIGPLDMAQVECAMRDWRPARH
jgi:AcrR family transcriptional regulator